MRGKKMGLFYRKKDTKDEKKKLSTYVSGAVRQFAMTFARGDLYKDADYTGDVLKEESSFAEQAFAVFMNNLETDEDGNVLNYKYSETRAAQYIRAYFDRDYKVVPPLEDWEVALYPVSKESYSK